MLTTDQERTIDALCLQDGGWAVVTECEYRARLPLESEPETKLARTPCAEVDTGHGRRYLVDIAGNAALLTLMGGTPMGGTLVWRPAEAVQDTGADE